MMMVIILMMLMAIIILMMMMMTTRNMNMNVKNLFFFKFLGRDQAEWLMFDTKWLP